MTCGIARSWTGDGNVGLIGSVWLPDSVSTAGTLPPSTTRVFVTTLSVNLHAVQIATGLTELAKLMGEEGSGSIQSTFKVAPQLADDVVDMFGTPLLE